MITSLKTLDERCLEIFEEDLINDTTILVVRAYCIKRNNEVWQFPSPQICNDKIYEKNKEKYDQQILAFRNDCEHLSADKGSLLNSEVEALKQENTNNQLALAEVYELVTGVK